MSANIIYTLVILTILLSLVFFLGYFTKKALEPPIFKRILFGPILNGNLKGRYAVERNDGSIHYVHPPITLS